MIWLCSSISGVTSIATPEKKGWTTMDADCVAAPVAEVSVVVVTFVTKNSSLPTFSEMDVVSLMPGWTTML